MELYVLDIEGTTEEINLNGGSEVEVKKALDNIADVLNNVELGIESSIAHVGNSYVVTKDSATWFKEIFNWIFSKVIVSEL